MECPMGSSWDIPYQVDRKKGTYPVMEYNETSYEASYYQLRGVPRGRGMVLLSGLPIDWTITV